MPALEVKPWAVIRENGKTTFPTPAVEEYKLQKEQHIYIVSGSKQTGGFCVMSEPLLFRSKLNHILKENPNLADRTLKEGELISYKGIKYGWLTLKDNGVRLSNSLMQTLDIKVGDKLLAIRSSDIAFTMGAKGTLIQKAHQYKGEIEVF
ncbi:hypothetical protein HRQ91_11325 [Treponema parvum]|uniref:Uncharacterized protein n=2 Tax=Treponema parvum TaxID=138851 RepID=A0A975IFK1_9SPIR|nr:hypothetical protein HRQ91_11325 [Treponema parvum]